MLPQKKSIISLSMNYHLLDCTSIVGKPNRTSVQGAENEEGGREIWGKAQVTGMIDRLESSRARGEASLT